ncbi:hypothetical protein R5R35_001902 [Gryllus longicercus]|uniref:DNA-(apurinic or apyrimidinic site) endonuclease n=1 Tax=Gryllus longicercus TaxID=2509291 RepID=A0AAN9W1U9_9ORTH
MPLRKIKESALSKEVDNADQDPAATNGDVSEGRSLRVRKPVAYYEVSSTDKKGEDLDKKIVKGGKKEKIRGKRNKPLKEIPGTSKEGSQENSDEPDTSQKLPRKTFVISKTSKVVSLNETFAVSSKTATGKGKVNKRNAEPDTVKEEDQPEIKKTKDKSEMLNKASTDYSKVVFSSDKTTASGEKWNLKISSWNVDGLRAWLKKDGAKFLELENPDILCLQETKCPEEKIPPEAKFEGYHAYWSSAEKDGYSGVALFSKQEPLNVKYGMDVKEHDTEGRLITAEYEKFYLVTTYVPNSGKGLVTLPKRLSWNDAFLKYVNDLDALKPVIICGDMNVSHQEIDIANPKSNTKNAGFTKEERAGMTKLLAQGFIDTFRHFYPDESGAYTFWTYMKAARSRNIGWRLDYFIVSRRIIDQICDSVIRNQVLGSDHCPITLLFHNK